MSTFSSTHPPLNSPLPLLLASAGKGADEAAENRNYLSGRMSDEITEIIRVLQLTTYDEDEWEADLLTVIKKAENAIAPKLQAANDWLQDPQVGPWAPQCGLVLVLWAGLCCFFGLVCAGSLGWFVLVLWTGLCWFSGLVCAGSLDWVVLVLWTGLCWFSGPVCAGSPGWFVLVCAGFLGRFVLAL